MPDITIPGSFLITIGTIGIAVIFIHTGELFLSTLVGLFGMLVNFFLFLHCRIVIINKLYAEFNYMKTNTPCESVQQEQPLKPASAAVKTGSNTKGSSPGMSGTGEEASK
jgi:uncharacterized membrane protein